jgi:hypothetical protein
MLPGIINPADIRKALGSVLYMGGCVVNKAHGDSSAEDCTMSIDTPGEREPPATKAWETLVHNDQAERVTYSDERKCEYVDIADVFDPNEHRIFEEEVDTYDVNYDPSSFYACVDVNIYGNIMYFSTVAAEQFTLHAVEDLDGEIEPAEPGVFGTLDYRYSPPELVAEWVIWGAAGGFAEADPSDVDDAYVSAALGSIQDREFRNAVRTHLSHRLRQLELPLANPSRRRSKRFRLWLKKYGPNSDW